MRVRWHGHACFEISDGEVVVTDPHDGKSIGIPPPKVKADVVLVSHDHFDHNSVRTVRGASSRVYDRPGHFTDGKLDILGVPSFHDEVRGQKRGPVVLFRFTVGGVRFCHLGDLGCVPSAEELQALGEVDVLFVPVGDIFTMDAARAWMVMEALRPLAAVPMHYRIGGLSISVKTLDPFLAECRGRAEVVNVGNVLELEKEDLPEELTVWVFSL